MKDLNEKSSSWNKLSVLSFIMLLMPIVSFLLVFSIPQQIVYSNLFTRGIVLLFILLFIFSPVIAIFIGCISYAQIKGFISKPKYQKTNEKGAFLSLISILIGIPLTVFMFVVVYLLSSGFQEFI